MIGLSEGHLKVVRWHLLDHFSPMMNFLPNSCQNKVTTQRLSRYLKVVTGSSYSVEPKVVKSVIGLSEGNHKVVTGSS